MVSLPRDSGMAEVYLHLGDADVHSLLTGPADRGGTETPRSGLFPEAAEALHQDAYPDVLSGGYRAPDAPDASLIEQLAVEADMQARFALSRRADQTPGDRTGRMGYGPCYPEPNTFVRAVESRPLDFGAGAGETLKMVNNLERNGQPNLVFDPG
ncbi:hypothetical protein AB0I53_48110 [Saccharopolyspora sp. NPDC050389]|uniref:hypothetical protein n=1 Tax=Saccharopolyspora sp. NPDC050389 TaxID=3155516 RepID=UPI0033C0B4C2